MIFFFSSSRRDYFTIFVCETLILRFDRFLEPCGSFKELRCGLQLPGCPRLFETSGAEGRQSHGWKASSVPMLRKGYIYIIHKRVCVYIYMYVVIYLGYLQKSMLPTSKDLTFSSGWGNWHNYPKKSITGESGPWWLVGIVCHCGIPWWRQLQQNHTDSSAFWELLRESNQRVAAGSFGPPPCSWHRSEGQQKPFSVDLSLCCDLSGSFC